MLTISEAILLLLTLVNLANPQVARIDNNNADFATGSFSFYLSKVFGNSSTPSRSPDYTMTFPSDFVSPSAPMLMISLSKFENYANTSLPNIDMFLH